MYTGRHMHLEVEIVKWLALIALASALAFAASTAVGAQPAPTDEPGTLPAQIEDWSKPMDVPQAATPTVLAQNDASLEVWRLLDLQRAGQLEAAMQGWQGSQLPCDQEVWRWVALGVTHLRLGELDRADQAWDEAARLEPNHPLIHYYRGVAWLMQGDASIDWYDRVDTNRTRLVSDVPRGPMALPKGMCELAAMTELNQALEYAGQIDLNAPLVEVADVESGSYGDAPSILIPTVADLLVALGADNFEGRAHNLLGRLYLDHGMLEQAEQHMDAAVERGMSVLDGYQDLGAEYEATERTSDAARSYLKAMANGNPIARPGLKALQNLGKVLTGQ